MSIKRFRLKRVPVYEIGDIGPGGGIIFMTPSTDGNNTGQYFEFATNITFLGFMNGLPLVNNSSNIASLNLGTSIGSGKTNTILLNQTFINDAPSCLHFINNFKQNGHNDWYIPSREELQKAMNASYSIYGLSDHIFYYHTGLPESTSVIAWATSSKFETSEDSIHSYVLIPLGTDWYEVDKNGEFFVLPIRSFYPYGV